MYDFYDVDHHLHKRGTRTKGDRLCRKLENRSTMVTIPSLTSSGFRHDHDHGDLDGDDDDYVDYDDGYHPIMMSCLF